MARERHTYKCTQSKSFLMREGTFIPSKFQDPIAILISQLHIWMDGTMFASFTAKVNRKYYNFQRS